MQYRRLGATGLEISAIAFGGAPLGLANYLDRWDPNNPEDEARGIQALQRAAQLGINYFDTAIGYGNGRSEQIMGKALREAGLLNAPAGKPRVYLATKTGKRVPEEILQTTEASLANLGVDCIDVLQFHGSRWTDEEAAAVLDRGGIEVFQQLQRAGKIRYLGFTTEIGSPGAYRLLRSGKFDVMQIAYNVLYQDACNFMVRAGPIIEAKERGLGVVTMRSLSSGVFQKLMQEQVPGIAAQMDLHAFALNFTLSNPYVDSAVVGMRDVAEVERNAQIVDQTDQRLDLEALHKRYV